MTLEFKNTNEIETNSLAEDIRDEAMAAVLSASKAMEAEAVLMIELEDTHRKVNEAIAEIRHAIKAEANAKLELSQAQKREKLALNQVNRATGNENKADKKSERKGNKLKAEVEKVRKAEASGAIPRVAARDKAVRMAAEAEQNAKLAHSEGDKAREISIIAGVEVKAAQERLMLAKARIRTGKNAKAAAIGKVARTEDDARKSILEARKALEIQARAKKGMDRTIRGLRIVMHNEARLAQAAEEALEQAELNSQEREAKVQTTADLLVRRLKILVRPKDKIVNIIQTAKAKTRRGPKNAIEIKQAMRSDIDGIGSGFADGDPKSELCYGTVKFLVVGPTDLTRMALLQERLERNHDCRVKSVGGGSSGEGTSIFIQADQPVDLLPRLRELEFVEWVSRKGKDVEVTLKPFSDTSLQQTGKVFPPVESPSTTEKAPGDLLGILSG